MIYQYFKKSRYIIAALFAACMILVLINLNGSKAYGQSHYEKSCTSIQIQQGDTLWSIASAYYVPECGTLKAYIKEIKKTNGLRGDSIHAGNYLLIPVYVPAK